MFETGACLTNCAFPERCGCFESTQLLTSPTQAETGQTVLEAEDKMDDGTLIKLRIEISDEVTG